MFENTKKLCDSFIDMGVPGFDLSVYQDGKEVLRYMGGYSDPENGIPICGSEIYNVYSCSKLITVTAAMQLWEKGLFKLEDELCKYMPEYKEMTVKTENGIKKAENPILIRHLFMMTAGFSYDLNSPELQKLKKESDGRCPTREVARYLANEPLCSEPGTQYRYSLGHDILAALVEVLTGQRFEAYVKENIFDPMGMTDSDFLLPMEDYCKVAPLYGFETGKAVLRSKNIPVYRLGTEHASGGAGCASTVNDFIRFAEGLRTYKLLKKETLEVVLNTRLSEQEAKTYPLGNYCYGLGMRVHKPGTELADFGWGGAAGAMMSIDIPHRISLFYAQHLGSAPNQSLRVYIYNAVLKDLGYDVEVKAIANKEANKLTY